MSFSEDQPFPISDATVAPVIAESAFSWWGGLVGTLLVFVVIMIVSLWIIRGLNRANLRGMNAPWARLIDRQVLNGQQSLYLVEIAGQLQVLGGSDHHLVKIAEIDDPNVAAEILEEIATRPRDKVDSWAQGVKSLWQKKMTRRSKDPFSEELERMIEEVKR